MFKNIYKFILITVVFILLFFGESCYAAEEYRIWNGGSISTVDSNKTWTINFNKDVDIGSVKNSIKVYEQDNNTPVDINITNTEGDTVQVSAESPYVEGKDYVLVIDSNLKSTDGKQLNEGVKCNFTVNESNSGNGTNIENYTEYYNALKNALASYKDTLVLNISNYDKDTYSLDAINKVLNDYPNLRDGYSSAVNTIQYTNPAKVTINFKYTDTKENLMKKENAVQQKVNQIVSTVTTSAMKDYEKELTLHDYVVNNAKYDERSVTDNMPEDSYTAYGILINGVGVCQGYADAIYRLLTVAGIECKMVMGQANDGSKWIGHAWNIVKIQGKYYQLDSTWDDPITSDGSNILSHSYFNITDDEIGKNHRWNTADYPVCNSTDYSFDKLNVTEKDSYGNEIKVVDNYNDFYNALSQSLEQGEKSVSVKILNYNSRDYSLSQTLKKICRKYNILADFTLTAYSDEISGAEYITVVKF